MALEPEFLEPAEDLLAFIAASPTPFHVVETARKRLRRAGFRTLEEGDRWEIAPHGRYQVSRNDSSLAIFIAGGEAPSDAGFRIIGAHTDSPNLRLKPEPGFDRLGYAQLGVEVYGSPLIASWTDRDLGLAGRVLVESGDGIAETRLLLLDRPIARVPQLAIHLGREVNDKGLSLNKEQHLPPILGLAGPGFRFREWLGGEIGAPPEAILEHDLMLFDLTPPTLAGMADEFLFASRIDNLASCHAALRALEGMAAEESAATRLVVLYDNEEIGSLTRQGAAGSLLADVLERITGALGDESADACLRARARSILLSADMAHAVHPNYADRHESLHMPKINGGPVIKYNANGRYATDAESGALFHRFCREADVPVQKFVMRADLPCGSTIGPIVAARLGVRTVDAGNPMLSMHSCREMAGSRDHRYMVRAMSRMFAA